ncbi:MAG: DUF1844 domain-containing protein [candidate division KSB1 bacterium]|jgi:hypothetical protein|nr:DUF1844 domain-containing protein [candidate division KSB1 bacterium]
MEEQKVQILFYQLILSFHGAAMQQMGKLENAAAGNSNKDIAQAQLSIDMIEMIKLKTEGNRTEEETTLLERTLRELRLTYVEAIGGDEKPGSNPENKSNAAENEKKSGAKERKTGGESK